ncbi:hypothetical protein C8F04DRAFT_69542 [Mycena alexandri]|uniref:Uncharacterized protein n=1 Tax=Mycena alexandri TaxID=1745969 RepID=A0AAD6SIJ6_9AGAR|nr:hypothetical protein C8F04DRAFT_69542 [Mycena alexandri]
MVDPSRSVYDWAPSPDDSSYYTRRGWAFETIEDVFNRQKHGEHTMFLGADISAAHPFVTKSLFEHARNAWVSLRYTVPTLAAHTEQDAEGNTLLTYRTASSAADARAWANRTVLFHEEYKNLDDLRYELGEKFLPDANGDQTFLHLIVRSDTSFGVLLHTAHITFDGVSAKIITTRFLKKLALLFDTGSPADLNLKWGDEYANLTPAAGRVLGPNEVTEGAEYGETINSVMMGFVTAMARGHGFKDRGSTGPGPTRRLGLSLSVDETAKFVQFAKSNGFTVNQVVHAALMMVCVLDNPPTADTPNDAAVVSLSLVNPRSRLQPAYSGRDGYSGLSLCGSAIAVPLSILRTPNKSEKDQLIEMAHAVKVEYLKQKAYPSLLAITQQQTEMMLLGLASADSPPWMGPAYVGDGRGEDYLDRTYPGGDGNTVLTLDEFLLSLNKTDPGGAFRAFSWRDRLVLSTDYNERTVDREVVQNWMDKWAELLRVVP